MAWQVKGTVAVYNEKWHIMALFLKLGNQWDLISNWFGAHKRIAFGVS